MSSDIKMGCKLLIEYYICLKKYVQRGILDGDVIKWKHFPRY